jgi:hypothetical protein
MSLDKASHSERRDELVPSRYAMQVGDIDVFVVSDGVISIPAEVMATNADPQSGRPGYTTGFSPK